jgi:hypothetical protein
MNQGACPASEGLAPGQSLEEVIPAAKFGHLYIGIAYLRNGMGITTGAAGNTVIRGKG